MSNGGSYQGEVSWEIVDVQPIIIKVKQDPSSSVAFRSYSIKDESVQPKISNSSQMESPSLSLTQSPLQSK